MHEADFVERLQGLADSALALQDYLEEAALDPRERGEVAARFDGVHMFDLVVFDGLGCAEQAIELAFEEFFWKELFAYFCPADDLQRARRQGLRRVLPSRTVGQSLRSRSFRRGCR